MTVGVSQHTTLIETHILGRHRYENRHFVLQKRKDF